jgi:NAD(P)-dependent dehydrogenase (short-subunit alcohol dehydrogenase family)
MYSSLKDKVALVIGGSSGLGKASARVFAESGAKVMIGARREAECAAVVEAIRASGGTAEFKAVDVLREADLEAIVAATVERFGRLDCAVNSAGHNHDWGPVHEASAEVFDGMMAVNVRGTLLGMKHQIRQMLRQGSGAIVNMTSILGHAGAATGSIYVATKHAVLGLTRAAALNYAKQGIRINCVAPTTIVGTPLVDNAMANFPGLMDPYIADIPMGRPGKTHEVGYAVAWLCSDEASFITGHSLAIDGGQIAK